ncbi:hypothetical protein [Methylomonas sp. HYX-M1]|uniref:hypothetical protein n=1 Tax=Methylomonas sp. HYX-M1 TaxID=3139307 RepID=UPI00345BA1A6
MLKTIDVLLGLSVVMLIASMVVTVLTQFVTNLANTRGKHLARGLADLLQQIDPALQRDIADKVAITVLTHPMISHLRSIPVLGVKLGDTIHREEFTAMLLDLSQGQNFGLDDNVFTPAVQTALFEVLKKNGIDDPAGTLNNVREFALQLEKANPDMAAGARHSAAMLQEAGSQLLAKVNSWFDQTIDRVADRFTASTRVITVLCSVLVVCAAQLDTLDVINRLAMDDQLRAQLVGQAIALNAEEMQGKQPEAGAAAAGGVDVQALKSQVGMLQDAGLINVVGRGNVKWCKNWENVSLFGILLSIVLVSLGAPFWYSALKNLLKLRGTLAGKDDAQRLVRESAQTQAGGGKAKAANPADAALSGERGIMG